MGKIIYSLFLLVLLISLASADTNERTFSREQNADIVKSVRFNGGVTSSPQCALTLFYNGSIVIPYQNMTFNSSSQTVNLTVQSSLKTLEGYYPYDITCSANGLNATVSDYFQVTKTGRTITITTAFFQFLMLLVAGLLFATSLVLFFRTDSKDQYDDFGGILIVNWKKYVKYGSLLVAYCTFIWFMWSAYWLSFYYLDVDTMSKVFFMFFALPMRFLPIFIVIFSLFFMYKIIQDTINMKEIERFGQ